MRLARLPWIALGALLLAAPTPAASPDGLRRAWGDPAAVRSTFFVEGMTCRACTLMLDLHLNRTPGVYWARFNYPLRLLTVYHDPRKASSSSVAAVVDKAGELTAVALGSRPAARFAPGPKAPLAAWKGGSVAKGEARAILTPFQASLREQLGDSAERPQVEYEILGEAVRHRILLGLARKAGHRKDSAASLPEVVAKDFYWPEDRLALTPDEAAVAAFLHRSVLTARTEEQRRRDFDAWLLDLWRSIDLDFRGESAPP